MGADGSGSVKHFPFVGCDTIPSYPSRSFRDEESIYSFDRQQLTCISSLHRNDLRRKKNFRSWYIEAICALGGYSRPPSVYHGIESGIKDPIKGQERV